VHVVLGLAGAARLGEGEVGEMVVAEVEEEEVARGALHRLAGAGGSDRIVDGGAVGVAVGGEEGEAGQFGDGGEGILAARGHGRGEQG
jgi:hypothetical protein